MEEKGKAAKTNNGEQGLTALLLVDIQNDFMPGGALEVQKGDQIIPAVKRLIELPFEVILASKDWHPSNHISFAATHHKQAGEVITVEGIEQILWPVHCVHDTAGSDFYPGWNTDRVHKVFHKGTDPEIDSYSAFFDNSRNKSTGLGEYLKKKGIKTLFLAGLTTEYCVKYSAIDAISMGLQVYVVADACKGVNLRPNDSKNALREMEAAGVLVVSTDEAVRLIKK